MTQLFTTLIEEEMQPSLGVTEPGAIAFAAATARSLIQGEVCSILLEVNSGIYKNAFTCGIPNTKETGNLFAVALGALAGNKEYGLAALKGIGVTDIENARKLIGSGNVEVRLHEISSTLYIKVTLRSATDISEVTILDAHTNIVKTVLNGTVLFNQNKKTEKTGETQGKGVTEYTLQDFWNYAQTVPYSEIEFIRSAYDINCALMQAGAESEYTNLCKEFISKNKGVLCSKDPLLSAQAMTASAIEARVRGLDYMAMSITGSGNHGIICTLPLKAWAVTQQLPEDQLLRATALSYLVTMYIKEYSGKLSAFCGCAIAAGTGACVGQLFLRGGTLAQAGYAINNMASGLTGIICTGGNTACVMKAGIAVDLAAHAADFALKNVSIDPRHGINGWTPEETMRYMGMIATPGMVETEKTIIEILQEKQKHLATKSEDHP